MGAGASAKKAAAGETSRDGPSEFATARQHFHKVCPNFVGALYCCAANLMLRS